LPLLWIRTLLFFLQVQAAAQEYQREFAAKDAAIQALNSEVEALQDLLHSQLEDARAAARVNFVPLNILQSTSGLGQRLKVLLELLHSRLEDARAAARVRLSLHLRLQFKASRSSWAF